jgi:hypothetical protein
MERRGLLSRLGLLPLLAGVSLSTRADETKKPLKIMFKSAWGSDDPTKAAFASHTSRFYALCKGPRESRWEQKAYADWTLWEMRHAS